MHASLTHGIRELRTGVEDAVFATDNISFSITCALIKLNVTDNPVTIQTYQAAGRTFTICSVDREYEELVRATRMHFYFCRKDLFQKDRKIESGLSRKTLNLIANLGHEWKCPHAVTPAFLHSACLHELLNHTTHARNEGRVVIALRYWLKHAGQQAKAAGAGGCAPCR